MNCILRHLSYLLISRLFVFRLFKIPGLARYIDKIPSFFYVSTIALVASNSAKLTDVKEQLCSIEKIYILTYNPPLMSGNTGLL